MRRGRGIRGRGALIAGAVLASALGLSRPSQGDPLPLVWQPSTQSPRAAAPNPKLAPLLALCGAPDAALAEVANRGARRQAEGGSLHGADELAFSLRAAGGPQVWPRAWSI